MACRIHRLGQTKDVLIKRFVYKDTIEDDICKLHELIKKGKISVANGRLPAAAALLLAGHPIDLCLQLQLQRANAAF